MRSLILGTLLMIGQAANAQIAPSTCIGCHRTENPDIVSSFESDVHGLAKLSCEACHGGDPGAADKISAKPTTGPHAYLGQPGPTEINQRCGACHQDQLQALLDGNHSPRVSPPGAAPRPTCINCHDVHAISKASPLIVGDAHCRDCHQGHFEKVMAYSQQLNGAHRNMRQMRGLLQDLQKSGRTTDDVRRAGEMAELAFQRLKVSAHSADPTKVHDDALGIAQLFDRVLEIETAAPPKFRTADGYLKSLLVALTVFGLIAAIIFRNRKRKSSESQ